MSEESGAPPPPTPRRRYVVGFIALATITLLGFAAPFLPAEVVGSFGPWLAEARASFWAPAVAMAGYLVLATAGVPQIVLITAVVAAFGPWWGLLYSWTGKMLACSLGFWVGRRFGAEIVAKRASPRVTEVMAMLARRGFWASALIRLVPTVPSVLVNIAAGATPMRFRDFFAGTALGSVPKMALMAFGGQAAMTAMADNSLWAWVILAVVIALYVALGFAGRRWLKRRSGDPKP